MMSNDDEGPTKLLDRLLLAFLLYTRCDLSVARAPYI